MGTLGSKGLRVPNEKNRMAQIINENVKTLCNSKGLKFVIKCPTLGTIENTFNIQ